MFVVMGTFPKRRQFLSCQMSTFKITVAVLANLPRQGLTEISDKNPCCQSNCCPRDLQKCIILLMTDFEPFKVKKKKKICAPTPKHVVWCARVYAPCSTDVIAQTQMTKSVLSVTSFLWLLRKPWVKKYQLEIILGKFHSEPVFSFLKGCF